MRILCRIAEYLKLQRLMWALVLVFAALGFTISILALFARLFKEQNIPFVTSALKWFADNLPMSPEVEGVLRGVCLTFIPLALTFGFVVCRQRQAVIDALVLGYWKNYLSRLLTGTTFDVVIIQATYGLYQDTELFIAEVRRQFEDEFGVDMSDEVVTGTKRTAYRAYRDGQPLNVIFDFSRNLVPLGAIVDSELGKPFGGTLCRPEDKFDFIAERIYKKLREDWLSHVDLNSRVTVVSHTDLVKIRQILFADSREIVA